MNKELFSVANATFSVTANYNFSEQLWTPKAYNIHHNFILTPRFALTRMACLSVVALQPKGARKSNARAFRRNLQDVFLAGFGLRKANMNYITYCVRLRI